MFDIDLAGYNRQEKNRSGFTKSRDKSRIIRIAQDGYYMIAYK